MNIGLPKVSIIFLLITLFSIVIVLPAYAHSGRTNAFGCHNDYIHGGYHCHNSGYSSYSYGYSSYSSSYSMPIYTGPTKSYQSVAGCSVYATTFEEVNNFNNIYKQELLRNAKCDELNFHVTHVTPHERLIAYLKSTQEWKDARTSYIAGCRFFDGGGNGHAVMINNTYLAYAGRDPNCDELEKHAAWGTSHERLRDYLIAHELYRIRGTVYQDGEPIPNAKVNLYYTSGNYIASVYTGSDGSFEYHLMPKGNNYYRFKVEIDGQKMNFKKWLKAGKDNNVTFYLESN